MNGDQAGRDQISLAAITELGAGTVRLVNQGQSDIAFEVAREVFRAGWDHVIALMSFWAGMSTGAMSRIARCNNIDVPMFPSPCGEITTDTSGLAPAPLWAVRFIGANRRNDNAYAFDLIAAATAEQLANGATSLLLITAVWVNLRDLENS